MTLFTNHLRQRLAFLFIAAVFVITPYAIEPALDRPSISQRYFFELAAMLGALAYSIGRLMSWIGKSAGDRLRPWILLYAALLAISAAFGPNRPQVLLNLLFPLSCIAFYMIVYGFPWNAKWAARLVMALAVAVYAAAAFGLLQGMGVQVLPYVERQIAGHVRVLSIFGHPNYAASFLGPSLILIAGSGLYRPSKLRAPSNAMAATALLVTAAIALAAGMMVEGMWQGILWLWMAAALGIVAWRLRVFLPLACVTIGGCLLVAGTRGIWLAVIVSVIFGGAALLWSEGWNRRAMLKAFAATVAAIAGLFLIIALTPAGDYLRGRMRETHAIATRLYGYTIATEMLRERPLRGWGYGNFGPLYYQRVVQFQQRPGAEIYRRLLNETEGIPPGEVHNDLLAVGVDAGLPAVFSLLGMGVTLLLTGLGAARRLISQGARHEARLVLLLMAALLCSAIDGLFSFPLRLATSAMLFWGLLGICSRLSQNQVEGGAGTGT